MVPTKRSIGRWPVLAFCALTLTTPASAAGDANAAKGIVVEHCVTCHEVPGYVAETEPAQLDAPSFATIANDPQAYDRHRLRIWLRRPHWPMQQLVLSDGDVENLLAFIETLRRK